MLIFIRSKKLTHMKEETIMSKVLELVQNILAYCKEGKAAEIIGLIKNFFEDLFKKPAA